MAVPGQIQGVSQHRTCLFEVGTCGFELFLKSLEPAGEQSLPGPQQIALNCSRTVGIDQFLSWAPSSMRISFICVWSPSDASRS